MNKKNINNFNFNMVEVMKTHVTECKSQMANIHKNILKPP